MSYELSGVSKLLSVGVIVLGAFSSRFAEAESDGVLRLNGSSIFPIGFYELPEGDIELQEMADAGVNLVKCVNRDDLDRVHEAGMLGWISLPMQDGATQSLRKQILEVVDHPALAVWEGPDEIVWGFTALSGLYRTQGIHKSRDAWWRQESAAVEHAEQQAAEIIPKMHAAAALVRTIDGRKRPLWMNEALKSDAYYVRQYLDSFDIIGCDTYPIRGLRRDPATMGVATEHWKRVGRGKPVWIVMQAFSWHEAGGYHGDVPPAYPSFAESRFMAYDVIAHGGRGIVYWGSKPTTNPDFRQSIYALTSELDALQPFLVVPDAPNTRVSLVELVEDLEEVPEDLGPTGPWNPGTQAKLPEGNVRAVVRKIGGDWLIVLVNEDEKPHMGVVVAGLEALNGRTLIELYGEKSETVSHGELMLRMKPLEVRVFALDRRWESKRGIARDYPGE